MKTIIYTTIVILFFTNGCSEPEVVEPEVVVSVKTAPARSGEFQATVSAPASVFPRSEAKVASRLTAPIERLEAGKGDAVRANQPLARLMRSDLEAQRAEAVAQVADAQANLEKVTSGTVPADIQRASGEVEKAAATQAEAQKIYEQRQALFKEGAIPERELLLSKTQYERASTDLRVAENALDLLRSQSGQQDQRIARSRLEQTQARLAYIQTQLDYAEIRSPADGVITEQFLYPGDMAKPDSPIFTVMNLSVVVARGQFPESQAGSLRKGQPCWFSRLDSPEQRSSGSTSVVSQAVDPVRRTVEVWCEIANNERTLKAGAFGQLSVVTATRPDAITVPLAAVQFEEGTRQGILWAVGADSAAHERKVTTGSVSEGRVEIVEGLKAGESVIVEGGYGLAEGLKVRTSEAGGSEPSQ